MNKQELAKYVLDYLDRLNIDTWSEAPMFRELQEICEREMTPEPRSDSQ